MNNQKKDKKNLKLYYFKTCPYCIRVFNFLEKNNLEDKIIKKNIHKDEKAREELKNIGGKEQVPCLFIDGEPLYESKDIIKWFKDNYL